MFYLTAAVIPGPNAYSIPPGIKLNDRKCGATLKSRPSPYVYSGFRSRKLIEPKAWILQNTWEWFQEDITFCGQKKIIKCDDENIEISFK